MSMCWTVLTVSSDSIGSVFRTIILLRFLLRHEVDWKLLFGWTNCPVFASNTQGNNYSVQSSLRSNFCQPIVVDVSTEKQTVAGMLGVVVCYLDVRYLLFEIVSSIHNPT